MIFSVLRSLLNNKLAFMFSNFQVVFPSACITLASLDIMLSVLFKMYCVIITVYLIRLTWYTNKLCTAVVISHKGYGIELYSRVVNELGRIWKEVVMTWFQILTLPSTGVNEENQRFFKQGRMIWKCMSSSKYKSILENKNAHKFKNLCFRIYQLWIGIASPEQFSDFVCSQHMFISGIVPHLAITSCLEYLLLLGMKGTQDPSVNKKWK